MRTEAPPAGEHNPHAGVPFSGDDATIAAALDDANVPALLCSLVHMTGDPSWIRGRKLPQLASSSDYQCGLSQSECAEVRRQALPAILAYRDAGYQTRVLPRELLLEMMSWLAGRPLEGRIVSMLFEDMQFDGADSRAIAWGDEVLRRDQGRIPRRGHRLWSVGDPRRDPPSPGRPAVHDHREERRSGRDMVGEQLPRGASRCRQPPVLLLLRTSRPLERVLLPPARAA